MVAGLWRVSSFYVKAALHGDVTSILPTERIAPKVQTFSPFDAPTFQDDDTPSRRGKQIRGCL